MRCEDSSDEEYMNVYTTQKTSCVPLTSLTKSGGCGCKLSPAVLESIIQTDNKFSDTNLIVGNNTKDDAAVYDVGGVGIVSTVDFFTPVVDDPFDFGRIAAANALSDVYAMGGTPFMAVSVLGWPASQLDPSVVKKVIDGGRSLCEKAGVSLCGGHSIDSPEPFFGLAVTGKVEIKNIKRNSTAKVGCLLVLTKRIGIGILTNALKKNKLTESLKEILVDKMTELNTLGPLIAGIPGVAAMTDVTGYGVAGHLIEMCEGSNVRAEIWMDHLPLLPCVEACLKKGCVPGGTSRNFSSYGHRMSYSVSDNERDILCDPQTSGGLMIAVEPESYDQLIKAFDQHIYLIGRICEVEKDAFISESLITVLPQRRT